MKIRFTAPTADMPFFHNVKIQTAKGWQKVIMYGPLGKIDGLFHSQDEMVASARRLARAA